MGVITSLTVLLDESKGVSHDEQGQEGDAQETFEFHSLVQVEHGTNAAHENQVSRQDEDRSKYVRATRALSALLRRLTSSPRPRSSSPFRFAGATTRMS